MAASPVRTAAIPATLVGPHAWLLGPPVSVSFVSFLLQWTELDKDKMELAQVCTKVPRYCPVPQRFKGRALEKVKSRRTTKKKSMVLSAWHKHNKKHAKPKRPKQRAVDEPLAHRPLCLRYCARTYSSDFQPYEASGPLCCLCGSLPDGEAVLHEQYVYSCRARVNVGGSWTSPQCTPASNPRPRSIRFAVSTYLFPPRGGASLLSLLLLLLVLTSILYNSPASPAGGTWRRRHTLSEMPGL